MLKRVTLFTNLMTKSLVRLPKCQMSDAIKDRENALEKEYIMREEKRKLKKLKKQLKDKAVQDEEYFYVSEDVNVEEILEDRENLIRMLTENGVVHNEKLVKKLLQWKHEQ